MFYESSIVIFIMENLKIWCMYFRIFYYILPHMGQSLNCNPPNQDLSGSNENIYTQTIFKTYFHNFQDGSKLSKQAFYHKIRQRGPNAFGGLVDALYETAQWDLVRMLSPDHPVNPPNQTYRSIAESKKKGEFNSVGIS